jgi:hypothetical protein
MLSLGLWDVVAIIVGFIVVVAFLVMYVTYPPPLKEAHPSLGPD